MGKMFKGMCVPICTPFVEGGEAVDEGALKAHIDWLLESGIHIILACGGTGEFAYLREAERRRVAEVTVRHVAGRADVFVQTSAINTADAVANSKAALDVGADAIMMLPPYFEGPSMDGVRWHYETIARSVDLPLVVYNIPQNTNIDITPELFAELLKIDTIRYIKDSTASLIRIQQLVATGGGVFNGGDPIAFQAMLAGCGRRHLGRGERDAGGGGGALRPRRRAQARSRLPPCGRGCCPPSSSSGRTTTTRRSRRRRTSPAARSGSAAGRSCRSARRSWQSSARRCSRSCDPPVSPPSCHKLAGIGGSLKVRRQQGHRGRRRICATAR